MSIHKIYRSFFIYFYTFVISPLFNILFLLIIWKFFHNVPLPHLLPSPPRSPPPSLWPPLLKLKKKKKVPRPICVDYIFTGAWSNSQCAAPYRELSPSPFLPWPEAISCEELYFSIPPIVFKSSHQWLPV